MPTVRRTFSTRGLVRKDDLNKFLDGLSAEVRELVATLRKVIRRTIPEAEESILWDGLSYHRPEIGGRVKGAVCQINAKRGQMRLDFIHGIRLSDPQGLLQGDRKSKRFVPINTIADANRPEIVALIQEAAALDPTKWGEPGSQR
jgi:hypothetical protein